MSYPLFTASFAFSHSILLRCISVFSNSAKTLLSCENCSQLPSNWNVMASLFLLASCNSCHAFISACVCFAISVATSLDVRRSSGVTLDITCCITEPTVAPFELPPATSCCAFDVGRFDAGRCCDSASDIFDQQLCYLPEIKVGYPYVCTNKAREFGKEKILFLFGRRSVFSAG